MSQGLFEGQSGISDCHGDETRFLGHGLVKIRDWRASGGQPTPKTTPADALGDAVPYRITQFEGGRCTITIEPVGDILGFQLGFAKHAGSCTAVA